MCIVTAWMAGAISQQPAAPRLVAVALVVADAATQLK